MGWFSGLLKAAASFVSAPVAAVVGAVATAHTVYKAATTVKKMFSSDNSYDYEQERRMRERREREDRERREREEREREAERRRRADREERERRERERREERERWEREVARREAEERRRREEEHRRQLEEERKRREEEQRQREEALRQMREMQLREEARAREIEEMNSMVRQYRQSFRTAAASIERKSQQCVDIIFDGLMQSLCRDERLANSYGIKRIERQHDDVRKRVEGMIIKRIDTRITLDDEDCAAIFRTPKDVDKSRLMDEFGNKILAEAKEELAQFVAEILRRQADDITDSVQNYLADQERKTYEAQRQYADWEREKGSDTFDKEQAQLPARVKLHAIDRVEELLGGKKAA